MDIYDLIIKLIPTWAIAVVAGINAILFLMRDRTRLISMWPGIMKMRAMSMFLWTVFYFVIFMDITYFGVPLAATRHVAMVRISIVWELTVSFFYNIWWLNQARRIRHNFEGRE